MSERPKQHKERQRKEKGVLGGKLFDLTGITKKYQKTLRSLEKAVENADKNLTADEKKSFNQTRAAFKQDTVNLNSSLSNLKSEAKETRKGHASSLSEVAAQMLQSLRAGQATHYAEVESSENLRDTNFKKVGMARAGEKYKIIGDAPSKWGLEYKIVVNEDGKRFYLCTDPKEGHVAVKEFAPPAAQESSPAAQKPEEQEKQTGMPAQFSEYKRGLNPDINIVECVPIYEKGSPPLEYTVEKSSDPDSFQSFLENYPIGEGDLNYEPKVVQYLNSKMPTKEAMGQMMSKIKDDLRRVVANGNWAKDRVSRKYLNNKFNNAELVAMVAGWTAGKDIRTVNYYKSIFTEGKLNLSMLDNQDCVDACVRLRAEYLIAREKYDELRQMGIKVGPGMSNDQIDKTLSDYFRTTSTSLFASKHHEIGHRLTDDQIERSDMKLEVGDFITFNEGGKLGGHTVLIMARARNKDGKCIYRIATSTLPATEMALYKGWISKDDLIGGSDFTNHVATLPGVGAVVSLFAEKGLKSEDHTVSIGSLNVKERKVQVASRALEKEGKYA